MSNKISILYRVSTYTCVCICYVLMLIGCATAKPAVVPTAQDIAILHHYELGEEIKEIPNFQMNGWNYINNRALLLPARPGSHYLLMLDRPCPGLSESEAIGFTSNVGRLRAKFDAVVVHTRPESIERKCYIDAIYRVTKNKKPK